MDIACENEHWCRCNGTHIVLSYILINEGVSFITSNTYRLVCERSSTRKGSH